MQALAIGMQLLWHLGRYLDEQLDIAIAGDSLAGRMAADPFWRRRRNGGAIAHSLPWIVAKPIRSCS